MAAIAAGCFDIGCQHGIACQLGPRRRACVDAFSIDRAEVTNAHYRACVKAGKCAAPAHPQSDYDDPARFRHPVRGVSWKQAKAYCAWQGKRLPTEAEWERAARGKGDFLFPWGDARPTCEHMASEECESKASPTAPMCSHPKGNSPEGLCDMAGNAAEWVADWYPGKKHHVVKGAPHPSPEPAMISARAPGKDPRFRDYGFRCAK